jgi:undecaprenyl-diphosphatase
VLEQNGRHRTGLHAPAGPAAGVDGHDDVHGRHHPAAAARMLLAGYATLVVSLIGVGLLLTEVLDGSVGRWDSDANRWLASQRTDLGNSITSVLTFAINTMPVIAVAVVVVAVLVWRHRLREALLIVFGLTLEITVFLSVTFVVARPRPDVPRLDTTPMTSSFPSGHTAAATVLYGGIALIVLSCTGNRWLRALAWVVAAVAVLGVALSRTYRGMHHPTDVAAGIAYGAACLWFAMVAVRRFFDGAVPEPPPTRSAATPPEQSARFEPEVVT